MTRLRTDQACLEAQVRCQVEQKLNAELAGERRDTERCPPPPSESLTRDTEGLSVACPSCFAAPGVACSWVEVPRPHAHWLRIRDEKAAKTTTAPDCAPAIAPEAVASTPARPVCACGQTIWAGSLDGPSPSMCADCEQEAARTGGTWPSPLDDRIKEAKPETKSDDATECAWSTPTSEGEGWK